LKLIRNLFETILNKKIKWRHLANDSNPYKRYRFSAARSCYENSIDQTSTTVKCRCLPFNFVRFWVCRAPSWLPIAFSTS